MRRQPSYLSINGAHILALPLVAHFEIRVLNCVLELYLHRHHHVYYPCKCYESNFFWN